MAIRIPMDAQLLGRTRFAVSPGPEIVAALGWTGHVAAPRHVRRWLERGSLGVPTESRALLEDLVGVGDHYVPDFLTPAPQHRSVGIDEVVAQIADTDPELIDYHLDIGFDERAVRPDVAVQFVSEVAYRSWRRPLSPRIKSLVRQGNRVLAEAAADAVARWFEVALQPEWSEVRAVLDDDVSYRADRMAREGSTALLHDLHPSLSWDGAGVVLARGIEGAVDWAHDGLLLIPSASERGAMFSAEYPDPPRIVYPARGTAALAEPHSRTTPVPPVELRELVGETRAVLLSLLDVPGAPSRLARESGWSKATVSYHLGILARSGLIEGRRRGRSIIYVRTSRGDLLLGA